MVHEVETILDEHYRRLERIAVPGGWLYRAVEQNEGAIAVGLAFVPHLTSVHGPELKQFVVNAPEWTIPAPLGPENGE